jgi:hypothetical protein
MALTKNKIYIVPNSGDYEGQILVFDHVESMNHTSSSSIPKHPVESTGRSVADHRYRNGVRINITANVSDQWSTSVTTVTQPPFQTQVFKQQKVLRTKAEEIFDPEDPTFLAMKKMLDKELG